MEVHLKALTPIWTGDINRECKGIKETGIIGSLRWWYEAVIRAYGGKACDPTRSVCGSEDHCDTCELFGCTGWRRKFILKLKFNGIPIPEVRISTREKRRTRKGEEYLQRRVEGLIPKDSSFTFEIMPLRTIEEEEQYLLAKAISIIGNHGLLGARASQGNGVIKVINSSMLAINLGDDFEKRKKRLTSYWKSFSGKVSNSPNLLSFNFWKIRLEFKEDIEKLINDQTFWGMKEGSGWLSLWNEYEFLPIAFHIRDTIRSSVYDSSERHKIFGIGGREARGSKVFVSHGYKVNEKTIEARIFGYEADKYWDKIENKLTNELRSKLFYPNKVQDFKLNFIERKSGGELL